ncbi:MAG: S-adenosylmethionine:tRNA ribosyltransferase-isomerase [Bacteroidetes bacterium]|nr:MAG: S-adenosylmethionine:tRNA ribosyltransferase-isomerase [Bacteroidota bacterium]
MSKPEDIRLADYAYELPDDRIARFPLAERDQSRLLVYAGGGIRHQHFYELPEQLPVGSVLVFNDTKVIRARLFFRRETGALIELLLLHPEAPHELALAMQAQGDVSWSCMIGRKKRWKDGEVLQRTFELEGQSVTLFATLIDRDTNVVAFHWEGAFTWAELLARLGELPLPPYLNREATEADLETYQTVYAREEGAVAAPTAGLHFTEAVLDRLRAQGMGLEYVTLHVGAGTFLPVKAEHAMDHEMHVEQMIVDRVQLDRLRAALGRLIVVGTTSMRLMESLYWLAHQLWAAPEAADPARPFFLPKEYPYQPESLPEPAEVLSALADWMDQHGLTRWSGETQLLILPGYRFQMCRGLITNYHLPASTLILLVAAFIGEDWRKVYDTALAEGYRFLSYGDSSLLLPEA